MTSQISHARLLRHLRRDPVLAALIDRVGPPGLAPEPDAGRLFGRLARAIIAQQISTRAAAAIFGRLQTGLPDGGLTPHGVLAVGSEGLRTLGLSSQKARYLHDLAERVGAGQLALKRLAELDDEAVIAQLTQIKGIGRWTAQMFLIFSLARPDVLPVDDLGFRTALRRQYGLPELPGPAEIERLAEPWRPYRSYAAWYLWRSLDNVPA